MAKGSLVESFEQLRYYLQYEFHSDIQYVLTTFVGPFLVGGLILHGSLGVLGEIYRFFVPPSAEELHLSALAALRQKRIKRNAEADHREAEKLLIKAIARNDLYFPAYLSLASLYIYRMQLPDKALEVLEKAKDRGPLQKIEPLIVDAQALKAGGNDHMVLAGGAIFQEHDHLVVNEYWQAKNYRG